MEARKIKDGLKWTNQGLTWSHQHEIFSASPTIISGDPFQVGSQNKYRIRLDLFSVCACVCMCVHCAFCMWVPGETRRWCLILWAVGMVTVTCPIWGMGYTLWSSGRAASSVDHWALSLGRSWLLLIYFFKAFCHSDQKYNGCQVCSNQCSKFSTVALKRCPWCIASNIFLMMADGNLIVSWSGKGYFPPPWLWWGSWGDKAP